MRVTLATVVASCLALTSLNACGASTTATVVNTSGTVVSGTTSVAPTTTVETTTAPPATTSETLSQSTDTNSGWVASDSTGALYVSWVEVAGQLTGTLQIASLDSSGASVQPKSISVTGVHAGKQVSLDLEDGRRWQGTVDERVLVLRVPAQDGTIREVPFRRGGLADYNSAVSALEGSAGATRSSVAQAKAQQDAAAQFDRATNELAAAVANLRSELNGLPGDLASYEAAAHKGMTAALAELTAALTAQPLDCGEVDYKLSEVNYARSNVSYESSKLSGQLSDIDAAVDRLHKAQAALYHISEPDSRSEDFAISEEQSRAVASATAAAAKYDADADATVATAEQKAAGCTDGQ